MYGTGLTKAEAARPARERLAARTRFAVLDGLGVLPSGVLAALLRSSLKGRRWALCLHRVTASRRPSDPVPPITMGPDALDSLIEHLLRAAKAESLPALTVGFDDGYADAAAYVRSRARKYEQVEWIFFVCPRRIEERVAFPWDRYEERGLRAGRVLPRWDESTPEEQDASFLADGVADMPDHRLATVEECRELSRLPNVCLGNHTNAHVPLTSLSVNAVRDEVRSSMADFERLFGPCRHFAFPHGTPGLHFTGEHVAAVREVWDGLMWSTEARPYALEERKVGSVLPRLPVDGTWPCPRILAWCLRRCWAPPAPH